MTTTKSAEVASPADSTSKPNKNNAPPANPNNCLCEGIDTIMTNPFDDDYEAGNKEGARGVVGAAADASTPKPLTETKDIGVDDTAPVNVLMNNKSLMDNDDDDDDEDDDDDLDKILENLDIDKDFTMSSTSLTGGDASSKSGSAPVDVTAAPSSPKAVKIVVNYVDEKRWQRPEMYSKRYRATDQQLAELADAAKQLRISATSPSPSSSPSKKGSSHKKKKSKMKKLFSLKSMRKVLEHAVDSVTGDENSAAASALLSNDEPPHSIIVYRGKVQMRHAVAASAFKMVDCELLLLTHGFIVVQDGAVVKADNWKNVATIEDTTDSADAMLPKGCVAYCLAQRAEAAADAAQNKNGEAGMQKIRLQGKAEDMWCPIIDRILLENAMVNPSVDTSTLGWQYLITIRPYYTAIVQNRHQSSEHNDIRYTIPTKRENAKAAKTINELDSFKRYAPLHYAVQCDPPNADIIKALCVAGADPNLEDGEGKTPMYYAERNQIGDGIIAVLKEHGGKDSEMAATEQRGALFGSALTAAAASEKRRAKEREVKELEQQIKDERAQQAKAKAEGAAATMGNTMASMHERGQKIEDLGVKARELNEQAATYGDLAAQLKEKAKKKTKWYKL